MLRGVPTAVSAPPGSDWPVAIVSAMFQKSGYGCNGRSAGSSKYFFGSFRDLRGSGEKRTADGCKMISATEHRCSFLHRVLKLKCRCDIIDSGRGSAKNIPNCLRRYGRASVARDCRGAGTDGARASLYPADFQKKRGSGVERRLSQAFVCSDIRGRVFEKSLRCAALSLGDL